MGIIQRRRKRQQSQDQYQATVETTPKITPSARALAEEHGIDWSQMTGTSPTGMITKEDVQFKIDALTEAAEEAKPMGATMVPPVSSTPPKPTLSKERKKKTTGAGGVLPQ